jgi:hypothetical protein
MNKPPAFQFYVDNFVEGTCDLTPHDVGCYMRLLCFQWTRGSIPDDVAKLERIVGGTVSADVLAKFKDGKNARLEREREKQSIWREKSRQGGLLSAAKRAAAVVQPPLQPPLQPSGQPKGNIPSPSPSPFDKAYSNKASKLSDLQKELADRIEAALGKQWLDDKGNGDAGKWINRIKSEPHKADRVIAEVESAKREGRIKTTPAQYAQYIWDEFSPSKTQTE